MAIIFTVSDLWAIDPIEASQLNQSRTNDKQDIDDYQFQRT